METVFDYSPTKQELQRLGLEDSNRDEYTKYHSDDYMLIDLCYLFLNRKQYDRAKLGLKKVSNKLMVYDLYRTLSHSPEGLEILKMLG